MSISARIQMNLTVTETLSGDALQAAANVVHDAFNKGATLSASSAVPATNVYADEIALVAGAKSIDLTSLPALTGTLDATGLKVQAIKFINPAGNSDITFSEGAANGYALLGSSWSLTLKAGQEAQFYLNDAAPDVATADRTIDVAGTGTETFKIILVVG